jgi:hypothetical protein
MNHDQLLELEILVIVIGVFIFDHRAMFLET